MTFGSPVADHPIDRLRVVGRPADRVDARLKVIGAKRYADEQNEAAPGVVAVVDWQDADKPGRSVDNDAALLSGP